MKTTRKKWPAILPVCTCPAPCPYEMHLRTYPGIHAYHTNGICIHKDACGYRRRKRVPQASLRQKL